MNALLGEWKRVAFALNGDNLFFASRQFWANRHFSTLMERVSQLNLQEKQAGHPGDDILVRVHTYPKSLQSSSSGS